MFKREWTAAEADEWTKEDWFAIVLSPITYFLWVLGVALAFLNQTTGYVLTAIAAILTWLLFWVIDPKLKAVSEEYEKNQTRYLEELEHSNRWGH